MEAKEIFEDLTSHLGDKMDDYNAYCKKEIARFVDLMNTLPKGKDAINAMNIIGGLISDYYSERRQVNPKAKTDAHRSNMIAYEEATAALIMVCKSYDVELPDYFIADLKNRGDKTFTELIEDKTPLEQERDKSKEVKTHNDQDKAKDPKAKRKKGGRQKQKFEDCIKSMVKDKTGLITRIKELIGDKTALDACPYIWAAMRAKVIDKPTVAMITRLCPSITRTACTEQMKKTDKEINSDKVIHLVHHFMEFQPKNE
jgi:hypothetical protein